MIDRKPEGYKDLLVYQKAAELQRLTLELTNLFPRKKNMWSLKDQMDRSARSGTKNIIEGWHRNTTGEYFHFLGYAIGSLEELKDDAADICKGLYKELMGVEINGRKGGKGPVAPISPLDLESLRFYPLDSTLPPAVQLYLRCKEVLMLLNKLQKSLDVKMDKDMTKSPAKRVRKRLQQFDDENKKVLKMFEDAGLVRLENGSFVTKEEWEKTKGNNGGKG